MQSVMFASRMEIQDRVQAIKSTWSKEERDYRRLEAEARQEKLANMLGLTLDTDECLALLQHAS